MASCPVGFFSYTIRPGDTLWLLSQRYSTTIDAITSANPGLTANNLQAGRVICIPARRPRPPVQPPSSGGSSGGGTAPCPVGLRTYTIQRNDTLWMLAQRYCTTIDTIRALNPGLNPNNMMIGQTIWIPAGYRLPELPIWFRSQAITPEETNSSNGMNSSTEETCLYTIEAGDTLWLLSQRFRTTVENIMAANPGVNPTNLFIGQVICVPRDNNNVPRPMPVPEPRPVQPIPMPTQPTTQPQPAPMPTQPTMQPQPAPMPTQPTMQPQPTPMPTQPTTQPQPTPMPTQPTTQPMPMPTRPTTQPQPAPMPTQPTMQPQPAPMPTQPMQPQPTPMPTQPMQPQPMPMPTQPMQPDPMPRPIPMPEPIPEPPVASWISKEEQDLINYLRLLWSQHAYWARMAMQSMIMELPDAQPVSDRLMQNTEDFAEVLESLYGSDAAASFAGLLNEHISLANEYMTATREGNTTAAAGIEGQWSENADQIANVLSNMNSNWAEEEWRNMLSDHIELLKRDASDMISGNFADSINTFADIEGNALEMADAMAQGIVAQFPQYYR
ncbi:LysM peptidoglycan-binding domain-containing protein [Lacrimispora sp.]|uniref:LysM peptidoglycan-binding domain-containing protein n=1 Tax=Lacrimispora sp. TaxID=2719234 RepID=UPI00345FAC16